MIFIIDSIVVLASLGLFVFIVVMIVFVTNFLLKGHHLHTSKHITDRVATIISQHQTAKNFYDVGCAHGTFSLRIKKKLPHIMVTAIDNDFVRICFAKMGALLLGRKVTFLQKDIFDTDLSNADIVYTYLWYDVMPPLEKKLRAELKSGALVITNTSKFLTWEPIETIVTYTKASQLPDFETLFIYQQK